MGSAGTLDRGGPSAGESATSAYAAHDQRDPAQILRISLWRHDNGAKWRAVPAELGPWWMAAQTFIRWSRLGVWERLLTLVQEQGVQLGMIFPD